ncbi:MAG: spore germination protein [Clostridia bacterium]|nr:spore germination protein [Clostridia bacterium]
MYGDEGFQETIRQFEKMVGFGASYDVIKRDFEAGDHRCFLYMIDGSTDQTEIALTLQGLMGAEKGIAFTELLARALPFGEIRFLQNADEAAELLMAGAPVMFTQGENGAYAIDARKIPQRETTEPDKERTLRGSHDGFVEVLTKNTSLLRRRLRSPDLVLTCLRSGVSSKSEVVVAYMEGRADKKLVEEIKRRIEECPAEALAMNQESLSEHLFPQKAWNPFPRVRQTERPDMVAAAILEGKIAILVDNCSTAMILPVSFGDFFKEANDYYFPLFVGSYYRVVRVLMIVIGLFLTPFVLWVNQNQGSLPEVFSILYSEGEAALPLYAQFLAYEFLMSMLRMSVINIPNNIGSAMSLVSGVLLGQFAIDAKWASPHVVFFMAFVAITIYAQQNLEFGYAIKFARVFLLTTTWIFGGWGLVGGTVGMVLMLALMKTVDGKPYFAPLIPLQPRRLFEMVVRSRIKR